MVSIYSMLVPVSTDYVSKVAQMDKDGEFMREHYMSRSCQ